MGLTPTLIVAAVAVGVGALCGWLGARPAHPHRGPRLIPYRFLMILCAAVLLLMLAHLVNLAGVTTGAPLRPPPP